jgi:hypothetical protein
MIPNDDAAPGTAFTHSDPCQEVTVRYTLRTSEFVSTFARLYVLRPWAWTATALMGGLAATFAWLSDLSAAAVALVAVCVMAAWLVLALVLLPLYFWRRTGVRTERIDRSYPDTAFRSIGLTSAGHAWSARHMR